MKYQTRAQANESITKQTNALRGMKEQQDRDIERDLRRSDREHQRVIKMARKPATISGMSAMATLRSRGEIGSGTVIAIATISGLSVDDAGYCIKLGLQYNKVIGLMNAQIQLMQNK